MRTIEISGRLFEDAGTLKERLGIAEMTLYRSVVLRGMPPPIKIGKHRFFDRVLVDHWLLHKR